MTARRASAGLSSVLLAAGLALAGCAELTEVLVVIDTDLAVPAELDELRVDVIGPDGVARRSEGRLSGPDELPRTLALVHRGGALGPVSVTVTGIAAGSNVVQRRARFDFVPGETRVLRMTLLGACAATRCVGDVTCGENGCRPILVPAEELEPYSPDAIRRTDAGASPDGGVDASVDACVPSVEACNERDDDCDGRTDEGFDLQTDPANCGGCGAACAVDPVNASSACVAGGCLVTCDDGFLDCDSTVEGCESSDRAPATCGGCTSPCEGATPLCEPRADGNVCTDACPGGFAVCSGSCVDTESDPLHCGTCGMACPKRPNATRTCMAGDCGFECDPGFYDCDGDPTNGCESQQTELDNCGGCGLACGFANGVASCATGACQLVGCDAGWGDCDGDLDNGCERDVRTSVAHCGGCGAACPSAENAAVACAMGVCQVDCLAGFASCDGAPDCETSLADPATCGSCSVACDSISPVCAPAAGGGYRCTAGCTTGTQCGGSCVDTTSDILHCGGCGVVCPTAPNATPTCDASACGLRCLPGFDDCNEVAADGCEADLEQVTSCGACAVTCPGGADAECTPSGCALACAVGTDDCDGDASNGCEADLLTSSVDCGRCGRPCVGGAGATGAGCMAGVCTVTGCAGSLADCDGRAANGCEIDTDINRRHCGGCGVACPGGSRCCAGACLAGGGPCP